ncbi:putative secondary metabolism biosynthetic enzyme [Aspergillus chevalieri]|uniref:Putative secondary metabolism biosynthetic enzyme n=1 Tax=Aspergillus chevalieri TaxID=182096 RepID=A0A7R7ZMS5_ASPCH|nr:putative secondary metabolism biosynthetic enzyme [Aspergillus chevalieri]BCR86507.1 putative secondary metabolism biosynthetic enzyme [Aspergillus chevalieri]
MPYILDPGNYIITTTPFFHLMGLTVFLLSVFHDIPFLLAPDKPMSAELATDILNVAKPTAAMFPPSILEDMTKSSASMEALSNLRYVFFAGAPLSPEAGNHIIGHTRLINWIGSSESGYMPTLLPEHEEDWTYFNWNPSYGLEMQPRGEGLYELVIPRPANIEKHAIFHTFPELTAYNTKDLFAPHPTRFGLWKYIGRNDDVLVLSNGEKLNPITMEKIVEGHHLVSRALVIGQSRFQTALLVEPNWHLWNETKPVNELIESIWPTVQEANQAGPAHGRIMKNKIGVASQSKPFGITPKGSTRRRQTIQDYADEIDAIYNSADDGGPEFELPQDADLSTVTAYLRNIVSHVLDISNQSDQTDFYAAGLDSLQTMHLSNVLRKALQSHQSPDSPRSIASQDIYANPTVELLARLVYGLMRGSVEGGASRTDKINSLLEKYTNDLPAQTQDVHNTSDQHAVILTGSTGSLGNYILSALLQDPTVMKVYCLNRSEAQERQIKSFAEKGLTFGPDAQNRVEFLQASFGAERFGLSADKYTEILQSVDTVIHNAWRVDFNITVDSFEDVHIRSVRRFVDFSLQSTHHAHIHFISSVATIGAWKASNGPAVPSAPIENSDVVLPQGYGESKHIGERICLESSRRSGVPTTIHRVGQIAGPTSEKGLWSRQEWLPTIVATSKSLGKVPDALGSTPIDWIPVDSLASIMLDLISTRRETQSHSDSRCAVFNLVNPSVTTWDTLLPAIQAVYPVQPVPITEWIRELEKIENPTAEEIVEKPALKLLDFYRGLVDDEEGALSVPIDVGATKEASRTMNSLGAISEELMANWLVQWGF